MKKTTTKTSSKLPIKPVASIDRVSSYAIYGRAGSGKTTLSSTFPKPLLLFDINDKGTDSISDVKGVFVAQIEEADDIEDMYYRLLSGDLKGKYKTIVFDTVTEWQKLVMRKVVEGKRKKTDRLGDWGTMAKRDWGDVAAEMNKWITDFRDLPYEVVFLAQERVRGLGDDDDSDNQITPEVGPAVMPSIKSTLNAAVNVIGNTFVRTKKTIKEVKGKKKTEEKYVYCLRVGPNPIYDTKIRKPRKVEAPDFLEDPTFDDIMDIVKGEV